jgi:hypothetical protein
VKLGKTEMLSIAYGGEDLKKSSVFKWHKRFKEGLHVKTTNEDNAHHFLQHQGYHSL